MRPPKGFGKHYFTLTAIQAHVSSITIHQSIVRCTAFTCKLEDEEADHEEDEPDDPILCQTLAIPSHASRPAGSALGVHCNCYYRRITRNRLLENPQPKLYITTHRFSNSVSSPPYFLNYSLSDYILFKEKD